MLDDDDLFELDEDLLNATDFSKKFDETGMLLDYSIDLRRITSYRQRM